MNIKYSKDEDILLLEISDEKIDYAEEEGPLIIHYSAKHKPVLIEILGASMVLSSVVKTKKEELEILLVEGYKSECSTDKKINKEWEAATLEGWPDR